MCIFTDYARNGVFKAKIRNKLRKIVMVGTSAHPTPRRDGLSPRAALTSQASHSERRKVHT